MKHKILIVDDDDNIRRVLAESLSGSYSVLTASEGLKAVELIAKEQPILVFLDIVMPGVSGLDVLRLVKAAQLTPVIWMLTGEEDLETATKGKKRIWFIIFQKSVDEFVTKGYQTHPEIIYLSNKYETISDELIDNIKVILFQNGSQ